MENFIAWAFGTSSNTNSLGNQFRQKRMIFFKNQLDRIPKPIKILDIGGYEEFWINAGLTDRSGIHITILNLESSKTKHKNLISVKGNATNLSAYSDNSFDIAFSNSVIEHLYNSDQQLKMAYEIMRVGKYHYVQTPNKYFIIEPHYLLPYFQFIPKSIRFYILTKTKFSRFKKWSSNEAQQYLDEILLLSEKDMKELFPSSKLTKEKFMGMTKSFVVHNFEI
ncbi:methyltransferase domain-containing protein [Cyclobacterium amurskyense]|uniref:Methyltransferase type 11 n=1 Tax=Cyclobacterium amurskyense TaxID=320787 RepID=A0A0H4PVX6_9BACT|nr:methyltransferase domain-containing protein [Cyclobacterium amurskyense]AKP52537.1 Methyltransferase type 11 [Cyclobacterium amurskyense]|tara:strand:+ start:5453 stop:6121 length:669 start_codon:yes stop_codon:yes gene_type:complete